MFLSINFLIEAAQDWEVFDFSFDVSRIHCSWSRWHHHSIHRLRVCQAESVGEGLFYCMEHTLWVNFSCHFVVFVPSGSDWLIKIIIGVDLCRRRLWIHMLRSLGSKWQGAQLRGTFTCTYATCLFIQSQIVKVTQNLEQSRHCK